ncbi:MAG: hypothetical protein IPP63_07855 [Chloracidobacterium sp.]|nr:hypothetical protein [Chloracidobacterium sp.]
MKKVAAWLVPPERSSIGERWAFGVPIAHWFRGEMKDFVGDVLLSPASL